VKHRDVCRADLLALTKERTAASIFSTSGAAVRRTQRRRGRPLLRAVEDHIIEDASTIALALITCCRTRASDPLSTSASPMSQTAILVARRVHPPSWTSMR